MFASFIYNYIKRDTPLAKGDGKWRLVVRAAQPGAREPWGQLLSQGHLGSWGLWPPPGPSCPRRAGAGRTAPEVAGKPSISPTSPPSVCTAHQSATSTPRPQASLGTRGPRASFPWRPEQFLPPTTTLFSATLNTPHPCFFALPSPREVSSPSLAPPHLSRAPRTATANNHTPATQTDRQPPA